MSEGRERGRERGTGRGRRNGGRMEKGRGNGEREKKRGKRMEGKEIKDILIRNWVGKAFPGLSNSNSEIIKTEKYDPNNN